MELQAKHLGFVLLASALLALLAGCSKRQVFDVRGVIIELRPEKKEVVIKHEAIPNYMEPMTMPFEVKDIKELTGLATNDLVTFRMIVTPKDGWIENLQKIGVATNTASV